MQKLEQQMGSIKSGLSSCYYKKVCQCQFVLKSKESLQVNGQEEDYPYENNPNHECSSHRNEFIKIEMEGVESCHKLGPSLCNDLGKRRERLKLARNKCVQSLGKEGLHSQAETKLKER